MHCLDIFVTNTHGRWVKAGILALLTSQRPAVSCALNPPCSAEHSVLGNAPYFVPPRFVVSTKLLIETPSSVSRETTRVRLRLVTAIRDISATQIAKVKHTMMRKIRNKTRRCITEISKDAVTSSLYILAIYHIAIPDYTKRIFTMKDILCLIAPDGIDDLPDVRAVHYPSCAPHQFLL